MYICNTTVDHLQCLMVILVSKLHEIHTIKPQISYSARSNIPNVCQYAEVTGGTSLMFLQELSVLKRCLELLQNLNGASCFCNMECSKTETQQTQK